MRHLSKEPGGAFADMLSLPDRIVPALGLTVASMFRLDEMR